MYKLHSSMNTVVDVETNELFTVFGEDNLVCVFSNGFSNMIIQPVLIGAMDLNTQIVTIHDSNFTEDQIRSIIYHC